MNVRSLVFALAFFVLFAGVRLSGRDPALSLSRYEYTRLRMGTSVHLVLYAGGQPEAREAADAAYRRIDKLEAILSHYRPDSEVSRLSGSSGRGARPTSSELLDVLTAARNFSNLSGGAFDVTVGPAVLLWREARKSRRFPDRSTLEATRELIGFRNIVINREAGTVALLKPGMVLDLSAIAKGYVADQALALLRKKGITRALVDAGGDIVVSGAPPGRTGWRIAVEKPKGDSSKGKTLVLHNKAVATSGDAYQFVEFDGVRYSHIVDPKTGIGVTDAASATVIALDGLTADALATALCVMPPKEGLRLVESVPGAAALIVRRSSGQLRRFASKGFPP